MTLFNFEKPDFTIISCVQNHALEFSTHAFQMKKGKIKLTFFFRKLRPYAYDTIICARNNYLFYSIKMYF